MHVRKPSIRSEIVAALRDGFEGYVRVERDRTETRVYPDGFDEPITVYAAAPRGRGTSRSRYGGIRVPASYPAGIVAGIRLDVQTILADRPERLGATR